MCIALHQNENTSEHPHKERFKVTTVADKQNVQ